MAITDSDIADIAGGLESVWHDLTTREIIKRAIRLGAELATPAAPPLAAGGLTPKQLELLTFIRSYVAEHKYAPSFTEMAAALGLHSKSGIHRLVNGLEERGYITRRPGLNRALSIVGEVEAPAPRVAILSRPRKASRPEVVEAARLGYGNATASEIAKVHGVSRNVIIGHWFRLRRAGLLPSQPVAA